MKKYYFILLCCTVLVACQSTPTEKEPQEDHSTHQHSTNESTSGKPKKVLSPRQQAMANIGDAHIHIDYSSPSKRGRTIWNGLVAYGQVWVTGAHQATSIDFSKDVKIDGQTIPKGKYAFFTIPDADEWTLILNENFEQHLTDDYDAQQDVIRVTTTPKQLEESVESLTYQVIPENEKAGFISVAWDELEVRLPIEVQ